MDDLEKLRGKLDQVDRRLLEVLGERLQTVAEIARVKAQGLSFLRDHDRESELLERIDGWARELGLDEFRTHEIYREIIAMSLKAQEEALLKREQVERSARGALRVAFQGIDGSYSQLAARKYFAARADGMEFVGTRSFAEALAMAESGEVGYAFLPVENTTAGSINQTYDLLRQTALAIVGEEILHVRHRLLGLAGAKEEDLRRVLSHPQALAQCAQFLSSLDDVELVAFVDTAASAKKVSESEDLSQAAIASAEAGEMYGLTVIRESIADQEENWTRFVVISGLEIELDPRIPAKTSLVFTTPHREGALAHCLQLLAKHSVNLTKLESRPVPRRPWEYLFYADIEGSVVSDDAALAVAELRRECPYLRVLGSYPARTTAAGAVDRYSEDPG
ncbi:MAG: prephenate dehydratase [Acidobacteria bacterium]|nr:prephenate dehydratase [Candidatus Sulfomarinibacter kjeldsenii]